ncbi:MAG: hypothetical protein WC865_13800 [Bacteroidales bacterium]
MIPSCSHSWDMKNTNARFPPYQKNSRTDPHVALGHYREKARIDGKYVMFAESIGYAVYKRKRNAEVESQYAFFSEITRKCDSK